MSTSARGRFVWYDLMTTDQPKAIDFYTKVVGWTTQDFEGAPVRYPMWVTRGNEMIGGSMVLEEEQRKAGVPPHWLGYIMTPNVDDTIQQAKGLGGSVIVPPIEIPTVGRSAILADPQGATFGAFSPEADPPGHEGPANIGEGSWHELYTTDYEAALDFYSKLFGWQKGAAFDMGDIGMYQLFQRNGRDLGGLMNKPDPNMPSAWTYYFRVPNVNEGAARITANGGSIMMGPMEVPGGDMIVMTTDPQGAAFALHEMKSA
ncbi:MAG: VOC family protein [Gemmatimonadaceae bacterium]